MQDPIFKLGIWKNDTLTSEKIPLRFIVPKDIPMEFCDYNIEPSCRIIQDVIHPASFDLADRIKNSRITITASLVILSLSSIIVWYRFSEKSENRPKLRHTFGV